MSNTTVGHFDHPGVSAAAAGVAGLAWALAAAAGSETGGGRG
jgi:hypothetical protein